MFCLANKLPAVVNKRVSFRKTCCVRCEYFFARDIDSAHCGNTNGVISCKPKPLSLPLA